MLNSTVALWCVTFGTLATLYSRRFHFDPHNLKWYRSYWTRRDRGLDPVALNSASLINSDYNHKLPWLGEHTGHELLVVTSVLHHPTLRVLSSSGRTLFLFLMRFTIKALRCGRKNCLTWGGRNVGLLVNILVNREGARGMTTGKWS